jgi:PAS domain S-box-containing protein
MANKVTYEELEQRVKEFEKEAEKRKQADEALRESEERFRSLVEVTSDWIWEVNQNGIYTYADPKVKDFLGYEPEEVVGKPYNYFMTGDSKKRLSSFFMDQTEKPRPFSRRNNIRLHKDGQQIMIETSGLPIFDIDGKLAGWRGIDTDISERKHAEEELKKHRDHLKELVAERTQNLQKVNEELRAEIFERKQAEEALLREKEKLQDALAEIKTLSGMLPICASCKKIRDDKGYWNQIEGYIERHSDASFSHGLCPECMDKIYGDEDWYNKEDYDK